ncbi:MAG: hypothetical protein JNK82_14335 [Myxococcaceae bacterium]|nr:hypothetical protein [Myxococcaceae bacterium]
MLSEALEPVDAVPQAHLCTLGLDQLEGARVDEVAKAQAEVTRHEQEVRLDQNGERDEASAATELTKLAQRPSVEAVAVVAQGDERPGVDERHRRRRARRS